MAGKVSRNTIRMGFTPYQKKRLRKFAQSQGINIPNRLSKKTYDKHGVTDEEELFEMLDEMRDDVKKSERDRKKKEKAHLNKNIKKYEGVVQNLRRSERIANQVRGRNDDIKTRIQTIDEGDVRQSPQFIKEYNNFLTTDYRLPKDKLYDKERVYKNKKYMNKWKEQHYKSFTNVQDLINNIRSIYQTQPNAFKFQLSFSYSLYKDKAVHDEDYRQISKDLMYAKEFNDKEDIQKYENYLNNINRFDFILFNSNDSQTFFSNGPVIINNSKTLNETINYITLNFDKYIDNLKRPHSKWQFNELLHYEIRVFHTDMTIGNAVSLPNYLYHDQFRTSVIKLEKYDDNLCFWRCAYIKKNNCIRYDKLNNGPLELCEQYYNRKIDKKTYQGIKYSPHDDRLAELEKYLNMNINIYIINEDANNTLQIERVSPGLYNDNLYLLRYDNHFCYIKNFDKMTCVFQCSKCDKCFNRADNCERHTKTCKEKQSDRNFVGGNCEESSTFYHGTGMETPYYPYFIVHDWEAMLKVTDDKKTDNLTYSNEHVPISYSICSNVPGFTKAIFKSDDNPAMLVDSFVKDLLLISESAKVLVDGQFKHYEDYFDEQIDNCTNQQKKKELNYKLNQFIEWKSIIPVVGFNSQKYDFNLIKKYIFTSLNKYDNPNQDFNFTPIKTGNAFKSFRTNSFNFLDICNYLAPGFSLDQWVKAYECEIQKGFFPYEYIDTYDKLYDTELPPHEAFYSKLKNKNISVEEYEYCVKVWNDNNMTNMFDFLRWYNNNDVLPMVEAIEKMLSFYKLHNLDMFKDAVSIPGLAYKLLLRSTDKKFSLFYENDADLYDMLFKSIVGGPSIIFNRYHKVGETKIRQYYGGNKVCKNIIGYDANALYLWAVAQEMPTGQYERDNSYTHENINDAILNDKLFGFVKVDIETPEHLKEYFSEMTPIFKNITVDATEENIGSHMYEYAQAAGRKLDKSKLLVGSYFGKDITLYTPLLKWYLQHGLIITKVHQTIKYIPSKCFSGLSSMVSDARRSGDIDKSKSIVADSMKLIGNSLYGRTVMNKTKFTKTSYCHDNKVGSKINSPYFRDLNMVDEDLYEVEAKPSKIKMDIPIQIGCAVYHLAKLRMLQFYYDCVDKYIDRSDFEYCQMDTDSAYIAFAGDKFEDMIKPEMRDEYEANKHLFFVPDCDDIYDGFQVETKEGIKKLTVKKYENRTPGLFKVEKEVDALVSLCSKMYCGEDATGKIKFSAKGIQKDNNKEATTFKAFKDVLVNKTESSATNRGFRVVDNKMITYVQNKKGLSYYYIKRRVLDDGVTTVPLDL